MAKIFIQRANSSEFFRGSFQPLRAARQKGMSLTAVLLILMVAAFIGMFAFKVVPSHLEYLTVKTIGQDIADNEALLKQPKSKVMLAIQKSFRANSLWELKPEESFVLTKDGKRGFVVQVDYEKRNNLFSNIDVVSRFNHVFNEDI